ncbi:hypothetical protein QQ020_13720 [Fulvivirgaceae bacterium BMA12]|uniref:Tetratricopeptide repeat protein n=1 Tax=Agaribacillus aureus TaxID=3051825 RepID=A0ABT8L5U1_9BACT|nr:hypothetical protein [Fulvivirgaceae bacterium BMA12]
MAITLADKYYLKALNDYPYELEEVIENLHYALSYDEEHAGANFLMGKLYMEEFKNFDMAEEYFIAAMAADPENVDTCESFTWLLIKTNRLKEALKLIKHTHSLKGIVSAQVLCTEALVYELMKDFRKAVALLNKAIEESYDCAYSEFLEEELTRVERKLQRTRTINYYMT